MALNWNLGSEDWEEFGLQIQNSSVDFRDIVPPPESCDRLPSGSLGMELFGQQNLMDDGKDSNSNIDFAPNGGASSELDTIKDIHLQQELEVKNTFIHFPPQQEGCDRVASAPPLLHSSRCEQSRHENMSSDGNIAPENEWAHGGTLAKNCTDLPLFAEPSRIHTTALQLVSAFTQYDTPSVDDDAPIREDTHLQRNFQVRNTFIHFPPPQATCDRLPSAPSRLQFSACENFLQDGMSSNGNIPPEHEWELEGTTANDCTELPLFAEPSRFHTTAVQPVSAGPQNDAPSILDGAPMPECAVPAALAFAEPEAINESNGLQPTKRPCGLAVESNNGNPVIYWTLEAKRLRSKDCGAVSPPFHFLSYAPAFKMMLAPTGGTEERGGASFRNCSKSVVRLKCGEGLPLGTFISFSISLSGAYAQQPRGPVSHDFGGRLGYVSGLPEDQEQWVLQDAVVGGVFTVCLEIAVQ